MTFEKEYERLRLLAEDALRGSIPSSVPSPLREAMDYSLMAGGKRLRPVLLLAVTPRDEKSVAQALPFACALEMVHTYSLIHDDLPCMDNDDLRRGKPTCHKVFGEGMAVLAGDGLLSLAFETMSASTHPQAFRAMGMLAARCGTRGMVAGQCADLEAEKKAASQDQLSYIHAHKTADLLTAPLEMGLVLAQAPEHVIQAGVQYGRCLGMAFQIVDDLLDVEGDAAALGKQTGRDAALGKTTWVSLRGAAQAREDAKAYTQQAEQAAALLPAPEFLKDLARSALVRVK